MKASIYFIPTFATILFFACSPPKVTKGETAPQAVRAVDVRIGPLVEGRTFLAEVVPAQSVKVMARVPGTVTSMDFTEGQLVPHGSVLAKVSAPDVAARVARVRSERKRAERERDFVCNTLTTDRVLAQSGDLPAIQLQRSERGCASAKLAVEGAYAGEREASVAKARSVERAPFDGEVLIQLVDEGQSVMPGSPILQFGSRDRLLRLRLPASDVEALKVGGQVTSAMGSGRILSIGSQALGPGRVIELLLKMDQAISLKPGITLSVTLVANKVANASAVPDRAIAGDDGAHYLLLIEDNKLQRVEVVLGVREDGWTAINPGLPKGSQVVVGTVSSLDLNAPIWVVTP